jgi:hypothetical protein
MSRLPAILCVLCALCGVNVFATTLLVDGVGTSPEHFATISEALQALGASGLGTDGASDEIAVTVNRLTEPVGFAINGGLVSAEAYEPVRDSLVIEGDGDADGTPCLVDISADNGAFAPEERLSIHLADDQGVTLRHLTLILTDVGHDVGTDFLVIDEGDDSPLLNAALTLDHVRITSQGTAVNDLGVGYEVVRARDNPPGSHVDYTFTDCVISDHRTSAVDIVCDSATITMTDTIVSSNGLWLPAGGSVGEGIFVAAHRDTAINLVRTWSVGNVGDGFSFSRAEQADNVVTVNIGPGCSFSGNRLRGIFGRNTFTGLRPVYGRSDFTLAGTEEDPAFASENGTIGISVGASQGSALRIRHAVVCGNASGGLLVQQSQVPVVPAVVSHCLFAHNGSGGGLGSVNVWVANSASDGAEFFFDHCTFHDVAYPQNATEINMGFSYRITVINLAECIVSGTPDEGAFIVGGQGGVSGEVNLTNCAVVFEGPYALGTLNTTGRGVINFHGVTFADPHYLNVHTPPDDSSFDVQSAIYGHAGPAGEPLSGWGDYVGTPWEGMGFVAH